MASISILLFGPTGCGKRFFAEASLNEFLEHNDLPERIFDINVPNLLSSPADTPKVLKAMHDFESRAVLIEDVDDMLVGMRQHPGAHAHRLKYLAQSEGDRVLIGTAKRPERLEDNEIESFQEIMPFLYPDEAERTEILQRAAAKLGLDLPDAASLAKATEWWSPHELILLVQESSRGNYNSVAARSRLVSRRGDRVKAKSRSERIAELLEFAEDHCTSSEIQADTQNRFGTLEKSAQSTTKQHVTYNNYVTKLIQKGVTNMGDNIFASNVRGSVVGKNIKDATVNYHHEQSEQLDVAALLPELERLRVEMLSKATSPEHYVAIGAVSGAEVSAKEGNASSVLEHLKKAGKWALETANGIGIRVAAQAITQAMSGD